MRGRLIVIDGTDGSGKATQTRLLLDRLKEEGYEARTMNFPRYGVYSAGFVERYLKGEFGTAKELGPYKASLFYAMDRFAASYEIKRWLSEGKVVVLDRYVGSNMGHQGGKIADPEARAEFLEWIRDLEYGKLGLPVPDMNLFLYVPVDIAQELALRKWKESSNKVSGRVKKADIHEVDKDHLKAAEESYLSLAERYDDWKKIECSADGRLLPVREIHDLVWSSVSLVL